ncbi:TonB-dependent receptor domain-containing protein [Methylophaga sp.]|uniref:TonB-dependent receptor domain-containing protein n=1 Tax=Methylophaga sp. TaxID=2024840 RepID=UPI003A919FF9
MTLFSKALPLRACTRLSAFTLISSLLSLPAIASDELNSITVTANRMPTENALAPSTVITRNEIEKLQINDLPTLLSRFPGVDMIQRGGYGKTSGISIRGSDTKQILILVDGVKWRSATSGAAALQDFPVEQIERIEIVRGSRSGIYGSEAIGGVIQIFTRKGKNEKATPYLTLATGTKNTQKASAGISGGNASTHYNLGYSYLSTNGIDAQDDENPDHDGYRNKSVSFNVNHQLSDNWSIGAHLLRVDGINEYDGNDPIYSKISQQVMGVNTNIFLSDLWEVSVQLSESRDKSQEHSRGQDTDHFNTLLRTISWVNTLHINPQQKVNIGFDYDHDKIDSNLAYTETSRSNKAVFASWQASEGKHDWLLSARHDDNEAFGHRSTGTADYGYWLTENLRLSASAGTGFRTPSFNDLYWPTAPNPDLLPEKSKSYTVGITGTPEWGQWAVNAYKNEIRDLIAWSRNSSGNFTPSNVNKAKIKGIEFEASTSIASWDISGDISFIQPEDGDSGRQLVRTARRLANLHIDKDWNAWSAGASWKLRGATFNDRNNTQRLGGYGLLDLRVAYKVDPDWTVRLTGQNMLNKDYQTVEDYYSLGRTVMVSVSYQP